MNIVYLKLLEAKLRTVSQDQFDMNTWCGSAAHPWEGKEDLSCGTVACALGHATTIPEFKALGLRLVIDDANSGMGFIKYGYLTSYLAAAKLFDITVDQSMHLFSGVSYRTYEKDTWIDNAVTSNMVADRILEMIANHEAHQ